MNQLIYGYSVIIFCSCQYTDSRNRWSRKCWTVQIYGKDGGTSSAWRGAFYACSSYKDGQKEREALKEVEKWVCTNWNPNPFYRFHLLINLACKWLLTVLNFSILGCLLWQTVSMTKLNIYRWKMMKLVIRRQILAMVVVAWEENIRSRR